MKKQWLSVLYCAPATVAVGHWLAAHPAGREAPAIAAATFGGLLALILAGTVAVPAALRRCGRARVAEAWRLAAIAAAPYPVFFTFLWSFMFLPSLGGRAQAALGVAGGAFTGASVWWARRSLSSASPER